MPRPVALEPGFMLAGLGAWLARMRGRPVASAVLAPPRRLLVVKFADIGDALGIEPALGALRAAHPTATIDVLVTPSARQALATCPHISTIIDFDKYLFDDPRGLRRPTSLLAAARFLVSLRRRRYDTVVLLHHLSTRWGAAKFNLVTWCTGARTVAGLDNGRGGFLTHRALDLGFGTRAEWRYWLDVVAALGIPTPERAPAFVVPAAAQADADALLVSLPASTGPVVVLHAGVGGYAPLKQWPVERFVTVARQLIAERGATILIAGGPDMILLGAALEQEIGAGAIDLTGRTSLPVLAGLLRRCHLLVGNESGVTHLAAAVGCRTLALFGPTNAAAWAPYGARVMTLPHDRPPGILDIQPGERALALRVSEPCSPCYYTGFVVRARGQCPHRNCLHHLTPAAVGAVAGNLLDTV